MKWPDNMATDRIISILSFAVILKDDMTPDRNVIGEVFLKVQDMRLQPVRHRTGYFLFIDFPEGKYHLTAGGKFYEQKEFLVVTGSVNPEEPFIELFIERQKGVINDLG